VSYGNENTDWREVDRNLRRLAHDKGKYDLEEGRWLLAGLRAGVHVQLGFGTFTEYVERLFGYKQRFVAERLRVAEALEILPETRAALESGKGIPEGALQLTQREKEIVDLIAEGLSNKEIAARRRTSERTVRQQARVVYQKSGLSGRSELAAFFLGGLLGMDARPDLRPEP